MSFAKSKRFSEIKDSIPGPGSYENERGCIGSDSVKHEINAIPRFFETCKKVGRERRLCIKCTCADNATKRTPIEQFVLETSKSCAVQKVTVRGENPNNVAQLRRMLNDLVSIREKNTSIINNTFIKEEHNNLQENISYGCIFEKIDKQEFSMFSTSSNTDDSGFSSLSTTSKSKNKTKSTTLACLDEWLSQSTLDSDWNNFNGTVNPFISESTEENECKLVEPSYAHFTEKKTLTEVRFIEDSKFHGQQSLKANKENSNDLILRKNKKNTFIPKRIICKKVELLHESNEQQSTEANKENFESSISYNNSNTVSKKKKILKNVRFSENFGFNEQQSTQRNKKMSSISYKSNGSTLTRRKTMLKNSESDEQQNTETIKRNSKLSIPYDDKNETIRNIFDSTHIFSDFNERITENLMKFLESILKSNNSLDGIANQNLRKTFVLKHLNILEETMIYQNKQTVKTLSLISNLKKQAITLGSKEKSKGDAVPKIPRM